MMQVELSGKYCPVAFNFHQRRKDTPFVPVQPEGNDTFRSMSEKWEIFDKMAVRGTDS